MTSKLLMIARRFSSFPKIIRSYIICLASETQGCSQGGCYVRPSVTLQILELGHMYHPIHLPSSPLKPAGHSET